MDHGRDDSPVLFAYDGSEQAKAAIRAAARQLNTNRRAIVLAVWESLASHTFVGPAATWSNDFEHELAAEAESVADEGAQLARSLGFQATPLTERGEPVWQSIVSSAEANDAGILVLGSHGRTGIERVLMGSVAGSVAQHTERPVLIVHAR
jgi:nucleotide-binding universal stress UspA family protein